MSILSLNDGIFDISNHTLNVYESNIVLTQNYGISGGLTDISSNMFNITNSNINITDTYLGLDNIWTGRNEFKGDISFINTNILINSSNTINLSGGLVNISGGSVSIGTSDFSITGLVSTTDTNAVSYNPETKKLGYVAISSGAALLASDNTMTGKNQFIGDVSLNGVTSLNNIIYASGLDIPEVVQGGGEGEGGSEGGGGGGGYISKDNLVYYNTVTKRLGYDYRPNIVDRIYTENYWQNKNTFFHEIVLISQSYIQFPDGTQQNTAPINLTTTNNTWNGKSIFQSDVSFNGNTTIHGSYFNIPYVRSGITTDILYYNSTTGEISHANVNNAFATLLSSNNTWSGINEWNGINTFQNDVYIPRIFLKINSTDDYLSYVPNLFGTGINGTFLKSETGIMLQKGNNKKMVIADNIWGYTKMALGTEANNYGNPITGLHLFGSSDTLEGEHEMAITHSDKNASSGARNWHYGPRSGVTFAYYTSSDSYFGRYDYLTFTRKTGGTASGIDKTVLTSEKFGINNNAPTCALDVSGNANVSGSFNSLMFVGKRTYKITPGNNTSETLLKSNAKFICRMIGGGIITMYIKSNSLNRDNGSIVEISSSYNDEPTIRCTTTMTNYRFYYRSINGSNYYWFNEYTDTVANVDHEIRIYCNNPENVNLTVDDGLTGSSSFEIKRGLFLRNGKVGIGTTDPSCNLHVVTSNSDYGIEHSNSDNSIKIGTYVGGSLSGGYIGTTTNNPFCLYTNDSGPRLTVGTNGNVGIGTTIPVGKIHVVSELSSSTPDFGNWTNTTGWGLALTNGSGSSSSFPALMFGMASGNNPTTYITSLYPNVNWNPLMIDGQKICLNTNSGGYLGIGTTNPKFKTTIEYSGQYTLATTPNKNFGLEIYNSQASGASNRPNLILFTDSNSTQAAIGGYRESYNNHYLGGLVFYCDNQPSGYTQGRPGDTTQASNSLTEMMRITPYGRLGIGTTNPQFPLDIPNRVKPFNPSIMYFNYNTNINTLNYSGSATGPELQQLNGSTYGSGSGWSICCNGILASEFGAFSDSRIKNNIVDIDDEKALQTLRLIKPKTYDYVDKIQKGDANVIGFIAQEIREIIPKAVTIVKQYIPNFITRCQVSTTDASNIVLVSVPIDLSWNPLHDQSGNAFIDADGNACSDASGNKVFNVKLYDQINNELTCKTTDILDKRSFLMDVTGTKMVDASGNIQLESDGGYFLYGQEIDDFHTLDKNAIFTVVTAAVQDIDRIVQAQQASQTQIQASQTQIQASQTQIQASQTQIKQEQQADKVKIQDLENKVSTYESRIEELEKQNAQQKEQIAAIIARLGM